MHKFLSTIAVLGISTVLAGNAQAVTTKTSTMTVTANVTSDCSITAGAMSFGNYSSLTASNLDAQATLTVQCTAATVATLMLGQGANPGALSTDIVPIRRMKDSGTDFLSYGLYTDTNRLLTWGNTLLTGVAYTGTGSSTSVTVYGRVTALQAVANGSYTDSVVATISF